MELNRISNTKPKHLEQDLRKEVYLVQDDGLEYKNIYLQIQKKVRDIQGIITN